MMTKSISCDALQSNILLTFVSLNPELYFLSAWKNVHKKQSLGWHIHRQELCYEHLHEKIAVAKWLTCLSTYLNKQNIWLL